MPEIKADSLFLFAAFVLPGIVLLYVNSLLRPQAALDLSRKVLEAVSLSLVNFILFVYPLWLGLQAANWTSGWALFGFAAFVVVGLPVAVAFAAHWGLKQLSSRGVIFHQPESGWDYFFIGLRSSVGGCVVRVTLQDGSQVAGYFGQKSFAALGASQGNIYIEQMYDLDPTGLVTGPAAAGLGMLLRPTDYKFVYVQPF